MHKTVLAQDSVHKITPRFVVKYKASANNVRFDWGLEPWAFPDHAVDRRKLIEYKLKKYRMASIESFI